MHIYDQILKTKPGSKERAKLYEKWNEEHVKQLAELDDYYIGIGECLDDIRNRPHNQKLGPIYIPEYDAKFMKMDSTELYVGYQKFCNMIDGCKKTKFGSKCDDYDTERVGKLRDLCQGWLDDFMFRNDMANKKTVVDKIQYFLKLQDKKRRRFITTFFTIYNALSAKFNSADGGPEQDDQVPPAKHIGF